MATETDFKSIMARLADTSRPVPMASLYHLSDLKKDDQAAFEALWHDMADERRLHILRTCTRSPRPISKSSSTTFSAWAWTTRRPKSAR